MRMVERTVLTAVKTDRWYDRHSRSWVVQAKDANDNQVGDAIYVGTKREGIAAEKQMKLDIEQAIAAVVSEPKITYRESGAPTFNVKVYLDGRYTGSIVRNGTYWHYQPKGRGNPPGESLCSVEAVKRSLEKTK